MQSSTKRGLRDKTRYPALHLRRKLAALMRDVHRDSKLHRLEQLVRDMNAIDEFAGRAGYPRYFLAMGALGGRKPSEDILDRLRRTQAFFEKLRITVIPSQPDTLGWVGTYSLPRLSSSAANIRSNLQMVGLVIWNAAVAGTLSSVRECLHCRSWFAVKKKDHRFCSGACGEKTYRTTDRGRARRAQYMRGYRQRLKRRDAENLKALRKQKKNA